MRSGAAEYANRLDEIDACFRAVMKRHGLVSQSIAEDRRLLVEFDVPMLTAQVTQRASDQYDTLIAFDDAMGRP